MNKNFLMFLLIFCIIFISTVIYNSLIKRKESIKYIFYQALIISAALSILFEIHENKNDDDLSIFKIGLFISIFYVLAKRDTNIMTNCYYVTITIISLMISNMII